METTSNNQTFTQNKDPRIDSPQIKVVYPSISVKPRDPVVPIKTESAQNLASQTISQPIVQTAPQTEQVQKQTKEQAPWIKAIRENSTAFLLLGIGVFALGYFIGKNS